MTKREPSIGDIINFVFADGETQDKKISNVVDAVRSNLIGTDSHRSEFDGSKEFAEADLPKSSAQLLSSQPQKPTFDSSGLRDTLISEDTNLWIMDTQIKKIYNELSSLLVNDYPNAVAGLFRVFVEISCTYYVEKHDLSFNQTSRTLADLVRVVFDDLVRAGHLTKAAARPMIVVTTDKDHLFGVTTFNHYVHSLHQRAVPGDLIRHWDNIKPFMEAMWRKE